MELTVTVVLALTLPLELVAVRVYVVVPSGLTDMIPDAPTVPILGEIDTEVAPVVVQDSVANPPTVICDGDAENDDMTGVVAGEELTVMVFWAVTLPLELVAVNVYVVVAW